MSKRTLIERMDTWFNYNYGNIKRFLIHPDDLKEAKALGMEHDGLPIHVLGVNYEAKEK